MRLDAAARHDDAPEPGLSASAQLVLDALRLRGASFFADLLRITALDRLEVERGLWELVAAGFVTADAFDNLRGLISKLAPPQPLPRPTPATHRRPMVPALERKRRWRRSYA